MPETGYASTGAVTMSRPVEMHIADDRGAAERARDDGTSTGKERSEHIITGTEVSRTENGASGSEAARDSGPESPAEAPRIVDEVHRRYVAVASSYSPGGRTDKVSAAR